MTIRILMVICSLKWQIIALSFMAGESSRSIEALAAASALKWRLQVQLIEIIIFAILQWGASSLTFCF